MTAVWIGLSVLGWFVVAVGVGAAIGCAIRLGASQEPDCQDEAEEIAALEAIWAAS